MIVKSFHLLSSIKMLVVLWTGHRENVKNRIMTIITLQFLTIIDRIIVYNESIGLGKFSAKTKAINLSNKKQ